MNKDEIFEKFKEDFCLYITKEIYREGEEEARKNFKKMKDKETNLDN